MPATEKEIGSRCVDLAESMIMSSSKRPSISKTQALILVIRYKVWTGSYDDAFMLMAQLTRSAFALRINHETTKPPYFMQESRRRLMWAIYILDSMISCGIQEYTLCPIGSIHIRLPCPEDDFELNNETNVEYIRPYGTSSERVGIIGHYIRIINIHDEVIRYTRRAALPTAEFSALVSDSHNLEHELEIFSSNLPDGERYSQKSLELRSFSPRLPRFIMTHVWWHQAHCQLFRGTLSTSHVFPESYINKLGPEALHESRKKCLHHAHSICAIFASLLALEGDTWTLDYEMAECAYTAAEILLTSDITLQNQLGFTRNQMTEGAAVCLRLMKNLQQMYPYLSTMIADIEQGLLRIPEIVPFGTEISQMIEIAPYQRVPRYSVLGQTCSIHDGNPLGVYTQSPISRASDANFSPYSQDLALS
ncbi:hypothetical protein N7478_011125 [Penicillium angulare]|uniref:uncharacterized protein n=1 Tax=Penicillium angulare TaxID=116970 RepID=UPI00253FDF0D|nr:uncharacterized protein N7478_011125 [Penicillium angulare]KAJ5263520.1 hypothetical protein N7478_011125 [Penicillium angulare]